MTGGAGPAHAFAFACVILATPATDETRGASDTPSDATSDISALASLAMGAGADPIVAVAERGVTIPASVRGVMLPVSPRRDRESALRAGLAQLANLPVAGTLVWTAADVDTGRTAVAAVVDAARATGAPFVVPVVRGVRVGPIYCARETWRELLTTPGGIEVVMELYGVQVRELDLDD